MEVDKIAEILTKRNSYFVDRFWGIYKTYKHQDHRSIEARMSVVKSDLEITRHRLNLLQAEDLALTAVLQKRIEAINAKTAKAEETKR